MSRYPDDRNVDYDFEQRSRNSGGGIGKTLLIGCLGITALAMVLACGGGIWFMYNAGRMIAGFVATTAKTVINTSELTPDDKKQINTQIDRVADAYNQGKLKPEDMGLLPKKLFEGPLLQVGLYQSAANRFIDSSSLSDEEKKQAHRAIQRISRGLMEEKIYQSDLANVENMITDTVRIDFEDQKNMPQNVPEVRQELKKRLEDGDLEKVIAECKKIADDKGIPDEDFSVDIGDEVTKIVDELLDGK